MFNMQSLLSLFLLLSVTVDSSLAFVVAGPKVSQNGRQQSSLYSSSNDVTTTTNEETTTILSLEKPLGMILEENDEGCANGVFVKDFAEQGSAIPYKEQIIGRKLLSVDGIDVTTKDFDTIMDIIINAVEQVQLEFENKSIEEEQFTVGTTVPIRVELNDGVKTLEAKVGDNLRQVLIDNEIEVYQGLKQKLGNCGGGGQCTFCSFDFLDSQGWAERSEYEDQKLVKFPNARLTCLNNIQGPVTLKKTKR